MNAFFNTSMAVLQPYECKNFYSYLAANNKSKTKLMQRQDRSKKK